jgi:hypothetical protein
LRWALPDIADNHTGHPPFGAAGLRPSGAAEKQSSVARCQFQELGSQTAAIQTAPSQVNCPVSFLHCSSNCWHDGVGSRPKSPSWRIYAHANLSRHSAPERERKNRGCIRRKLKAPRCWIDQATVVAHLRACNLSRHSAPGRERQNRGCILN